MTAPTLRLALTINPGCAQCPEYAVACPEGADHEGLCPDCDAELHAMLLDTQAGALCPRCLDDHPPMGACDGIYGDADRREDDAAEREGE
jgi:hypothetical protein